MKNVWNFMVIKWRLQEIATWVIIWEISDSNLETGRYGPKSGVTLIIRESWQHWDAFSEMPTSSDLKSGDSLFCTSYPPPPLKCQQPHHPHSSPHKLTQLPWLRTFYEVLHAIKICFHHCIKKRAKFQTTVQKSSKVHFIWEIWFGVRESRRSVPYPGDFRIIWESWHICFLSGDYLSVRQRFSKWAHKKSSRSGSLKHIPVI